MDIGSPYGIVVPRGDSPYREALMKTNKRTLGEFSPRVLISSRLLCPQVIFVLGDLPFKESLNFILSFSLSFIDYLFILIRSSEKV
jgi:hypothetical protein